MRITIKHNINGKTVTRDFIVKIQYDHTKPLTETTHGKDEYGRDVEYKFTWRERSTTVSLHEFNPNVEPDSKVVFVGTTTCNYRDVRKYKKAKGRLFAWHHALDEAFNRKAITKDEYDVMYGIKLAATAYVIDLAEKTVTVVK